MTDTSVQDAAQARRASDIPSDALIIAPTRGPILFPGLVLPITINGAAAIAAVQAAARAERPIGLFLQRDPNVEEPGAADLYEVGVVANILRYVAAPDGVHHLICQGDQRVRLGDVMRERPFILTRAARIPEPEGKGAEIEARLLNLRNQALEALQLLPQVPEELVQSVQNAQSAGGLTDLIAAYMDSSIEEKQAILETIDLPARMDRVSRALAHQLEVLRLSAEIGRNTKAAFDERQRETLLREQMAQIQRQLGEGENEDIKQLRARIDDAKLPPEADQAARKELARLEKMPDASTEYGMTRTYLDWLLELPWNLPAEEEIDLAEARAVLEADHFGLEKIKQRIIEFLAVRKLAPAGKAPILCFVGPPGVGKTSLGQSIARAMKRKFVRVSLGGVHDESEIRGHRRTYVGSLPGNIIQAIRKAGQRNCVMMLDEIDKMSASIQGDPSAAMLEVLDPEQNSTFRDAYLGVPFDLSAVVFIATANMLDTIPGPLRDRMEIISLAGYTDEEKLQIAKRYLLPRQHEANGLKPSEVEIDDDGLRLIIRAYTRESGVRNLEREIGRVLRHIAVAVAEKREIARRLGPKEVEEILGPERFEDEVAARTAVPGVATGLAYTPVGGDILFIEAARMPGRGNLTLTGQLGDVMRESVQAAFTLVKGHAEELGIAPGLIEKTDVHVHVPAGATPKDGPSAGVAMYVALVSLLTGRTVRADTAMTGEISLRGLVLPVGGIKEKVTAAARAGIKRVMLPARNKRDFEDIPEQARDKLSFVWLENVDQAIAEALDPAGGAPQSTSKSVSNGAKRVRATGSSASASSDKR
jgi:ATP-dependent Lon protease